jgi:hypothetical protein
LSGVRGRFRVEPAGGEVFPHLLVGDLDEPRVLENVLDFSPGGIATDVLLLDYIPEMCPLADAMADVFENLSLPVMVVLF